MFRRFFSKKSGFTLVEIIIAFAVFSIMATMIVQLLDLAIKARRRNMEYQEWLDKQTQQLSILAKDGSDYKDDDGTITLKFDNDVTVELDYDRKTTLFDAENDAAGLNYFVSGVDYKGESDTGIFGGFVSNSGGDAEGGGTGGGSNTNSNTGSQMSRMDTRITGTAGIDYIEIARIIEDPFVHEGELALDEDHSRYFFLVYASGGVNPFTLRDEDVPYAQFRLYLYSDELNKAASEAVYTDEGGRQYTKDVYEAAKITKVGYLKSFIKSDLESNGLLPDNIMDSYGTSNNRYSVEQTSDNVIRIGSPFVKYQQDSGYDNSGVRFKAGEAIAFYVEFEGNPHLTTESFGANGFGYGEGTKYDSAFEGGTLYKACPKFEYDSVFDPFKYDTYDTYVNIYGAFWQTRNYK